MDLTALQSHRFAPEEVRYDARDVMLYALGVNLGLDPTDPGELRHVYENGLVVLPSFATVLGTQDSWFTAPEFGIDRVKVLHLEQEIEIVRPLPPEGRMRIDYVVEGVADRGARRGAVLRFGKRLSDVATGAEQARVHFTLLCRGDGGCGSFGSVPPPPPSVPDRAPDLRVTRKSDPRSALIYRLSGDRNPLHADPAVAARAGYDRPILHGLCTLGMATHALLSEVAEGDPARFAGLACRFSRPVFPGDRLTTEIWRREGGAQFRVVAEERGETVISRGVMRLTG